MQSLKTKDVVTYCTMPRVVPRFRGLFSSGFGYIAFLMAHIYSVVRILPQNHPYVQAENMGRFGIRHVVAEATRHLNFSLKHIDQILIYFALLAGLLVLFAQIIVILYAFISPYMMPAVMAFSWFDTADPDVDVAYNILDRIFGVPDIFCSSFTPANCTAYSADADGDSVPGPVIPLPYHTALHGLFRFYSTALMLIAVLIFVYFVVVIVLETAVSGTPFGQRFQNIWAPIRLVVAIGLLLPLNYGLGSGQYIVLYAAKYGSSFATNGWLSYNTGVASHTMFGGGTNPWDGNPVGERYTHFAMPEMPDITPLIETMSIVHACAYAYHRMYAGKPNPVDPSITIGSLLDDYTDASSNNKIVSAYYVKSPTTSMVAADGNVLNVAGNVTATDRASQSLGNSPVYAVYNFALGFYYGNDIIIRFGQYSDTSYPDETGYVKPLCGDVRIPVSDLTDMGGALLGRGGADYMLRHYFNTVINMWYNDTEMRQFARAMVGKTLYKENPNATAQPGLDVCDMSYSDSGGQLAGVGSGFASGGAFYPGTPAGEERCRTHSPTNQWRQEMVVRYSYGSNGLRQAIIDAWRLYVTGPSAYVDYTQEMTDLGWGGAGVWYNRLAEINGGWMDGVNGVPSFEQYPLGMEQVRAAKAQENQSETWDKYNPTTVVRETTGPKGIVIEEGGEVLEQVAKPLSDVHAYWNKNDVKNENNLSRLQMENVFTTAMNMLLGTQGLAAMRTSNQHLHPLAQLVAVGKGLVDAAVRNMTVSSGTAFLGGVLGSFEKTRGMAAFAESFSQAFYSMAFLGLTAGFVLFYVLPFLPFIYFYFAVASWVKSIFEAMVGVPLWALAHLRLDGDGLPGDAAQNGYFLILEIFIRPILTVIGLVAAIIIFATQVQILDIIWDLVAANAAGFSLNNDILGMGEVADVDFRRGVVDQFFFTIIYTIICYMMALASFKLVDKIPDNILRWAGAGVSSFGDIDQESIDSITRYASMGGMTIGNQAAGAIRDVSKGGGTAVGGLLRDFVGNGGQGKTPPSGGS